MEEFKSTQIDDIKVGYSRSLMSDDLFRAIDRLYEDGVTNDLERIDILAVMVNNLLQDLLSLPKFNETYDYDGKAFSHKSSDATSFLTKPSLLIKNSFDRLSQDINERFFRSDVNRTIENIINVLTEDIERLENYINNFRLRGVIFSIGNYINFSVLDESTDATGLDPERLEGLAKETLLRELREKNLHY